MNHPIQILKSDGTRQEFKEEKLIHSLRRVGATQDVIAEIVKHVQSELHENITTKQIYKHAFELLKKHSAPVAIKYSVRRALFELGPNGFPFEKFVAKIFQVWGYETLTDQIIIGVCVPHEMDVVAWKDNELSMVEAKFHNTLGLSSDVKVALYIKARFDDIQGNTFDYGGKKRTLTGRWLITNTKFSEQAIHYGECNNIKMVGWNYPAKNNLNQIIEQNGLYPITTIPSLSTDAKRDLIGRGVLVCKDIIDHPEHLSSIGIKNADSEKILSEARIIVEQIN